MRVLVVGGAGYIGSHTAKLLATTGHEVVVVDNLSEGHEWAAKWGPLVRADLGDTVALRGALREHRPDAVIHFAANAYVGESMQNPRKYFHNNVVGSLSLLDAMVDEGVGRIVFSSTCATYGIPHTVPIPPDHPQQPINPYGETKLMVEKILSWYGQAYGLKSVALRYFNAAGADPDGQIGEEHDPETHLIPLAVLAALGRRPRLDLFGTDYDTRDGTAIRDYIHVLDLAQAHIDALGYMDREMGGQATNSAAMNVGTGTGHTVREVIRAVEEVGGRPVPVQEGPRRPGDPPALVADAHDTAQKLGWTPRYSDLRTIVETAWRWHTRRSQ